jgi:hypothetical protein
MPLIVGGKMFCFFAFIIEDVPLIAPVDLGYFQIFSLCGMRDE